jgi:hypothetical protein
VVVLLFTGQVGLTMSACNAHAPHDMTEAWRMMAFLCRKLSC